MTGRLRDARGTIVIVHGLGEHIGRYEHVAARLNAHGWRVVGYDHRGHGASPGARGVLDAGDDLLRDLARVVDVVRSEAVGSLVLLGHSLGGLVAARFVSGGLEASRPAWQREVDALVLSSPVLATAMTMTQKLMLAVFGRIAPRHAVANGIDARWLSHDAAVVAAYLADPLVHARIAPSLARFVVDSGPIVQALAPRWQVPTLLLYAGSDRVVLPAGSAAFAAAAPTRVVTTRAFPTLFHEIFNEPEQAEVLSVLTGWLDTLDLSSTRSPQVNARDPLQPIQKDEAEALGRYAERVWDEEIVPQITKYIEVPAKSPMFDAEWQQHGYIDHVVRDAAAWVERQQVAGLKLEVIRLEGRTPVIFFDVPATKPGGNDAGADTICLYGHLDKQPEFNGWKNGYGPWTPRYENGLLYGRGGADDGYAVYAAITAIQALDKQGIARPRCVGLIETCEESGSPDLPVYVDALRERLGHIALVVCLDSGAGNYDQLWLTTSLRGNVTGTLKVEILTEGVHSGDSSGLVPSSFRILRQVLDRLEDSKTGRLLPESFHCEMPADRLEQAKATARILGDEVWKRFPWACGADGGPTLPTTTDPVEALINRTWKPTLSVTGVDGFPAMKDAGNVLRPYTAFKLSLRTPPLVDGNVAAQTLKTLLEDNAPYNAKVTFHTDARAGDVASGATGWNAPALAPWLEDALNAASQAQFGAPCGYVGQGGTIPLMSMLQQSFPKAQMMVCGVLGPKSNAHGPNEFLHVPYGKKLTAAVAQVMAACA